MRRSEWGLAPSYRFLPMAFHALTRNDTGSATGFWPSINCQMRAAMSLLDEAAFRKIQDTLRESLTLTF
jgi:hypothetical protein